MSFSAIDLEGFIGGTQLPAKLPRLDVDQELLRSLSPRLISLKWAAKNRPQSFAPALFLFSVRRREAIAGMPDLLPAQGWSALALIPAADHLRIRLGASWDPLPRRGTWPDHLYNAVDDAVAAYWYLRAGLPVPAAVIARTLLERWTLSVAHHHGLERGPTEADEAFISRVWSKYPHHDIPRDAGRWWGWLSELLHARPGSQAFGIDAAAAITLSPKSNIPHHIAIGRVTELCLRQIRGGLTTLAEEHGATDALLSLQVPAPHWLPTDEPFPLMSAHLPLEYYEAHRWRSEQWTQLAGIYRQNVLDDEAWGLTTGFHPVMTIEAFLERRGRAVERARLAFKSEIDELGAKFDPGYLASKIFRFMSIAQMARLVIATASPLETNALLVAAQAVEGATYQWLEDSDYALGCIRVLLEQTARLRVHRLKASRARRLEEIGRPTSSRWISEAGWSRLAVLMRAVNEFAHLGVRTRRRGARDILEKLQGADRDPRTSRGDAVESVIYMFAFELHARLAQEDAGAAKVFTESVTLVDEESHIERLERYLDNANRWRMYDFGDPDSPPSLRRPENSSS